MVCLGEDDGFVLECYVEFVVYVGGDLVGEREQCVCGVIVVVDECECVV